MKSTRKSDYDSPFAKKLRDLLENHSISKTQLAKELGVKQQTVSQWADGYTTPELKHLKPLALYFEISIDELVTGVAPENENIHLDTGLSSPVIDILKKLNTDTENKFNNKMIIEFINIIIETMNSKFYSLSRLSRLCMEYIIGAHGPKLEQEELIRQEAQGWEILCSIDRPNFKNDTLDFKTFQLIKDFEYFMEHLAINPKIANRVKKIYEDASLKAPNYSDSRFAPNVFVENGLSCEKLSACSENSKTKDNTNPLLD